jgi:serine phosphatase RsbU (regulator of sigma subunit)/pSer/pThr/pTyr-binding forkhead associated (FHA) protein
MSKLVLLQAGEAIPYELTADVTLGRHPDCDIQLPSNMVSRKHARVFVENGQTYVEDLGSGNGTLLNGKKIEGKTPLNHEDRIKLGPILLRFESDAPATKPARKVLSSSATAATLAFKMDLAADDDDSATIMDSVDNSSGFGMLNAQPEAKLKGVLEISKSLAGTVDLETLLPKILDSLFTVFPQADRGCILLKDPETGQMLPRGYKHRRPGIDDTVKMSKTILNKVLAEKTGILSADAASDSRFEQSESISGLSIRSMMCVPMLGLEGEPTGVIQLDTQNPLQRFQKEDIDLLLAVAGQAALSYESARLLVSAMQKKKQDEEMQIARGVQQALLPEQLPVVDGYRFFASYDSAQAVGGDYYDCFLLDDGKRVCLSFGDVAGKGVPASLVMSRMSSVVQSTVAHVQDVGEAVAAINNHMCANAVEGRFVTYVMAMIDLTTHAMSLVIAGHMSPIVRKPDGSIEEFDESNIGLPVGVMPDYPFEVIQRTLEPGEIVVIYTDGVSEAMNPNGDLYNEERVREIVKTGPAEAEELGKALLADVRRHAAGRPQNDDITIMTFGRNRA